MRFRCPSFEWFYLDRLCHSELLTLKGHTKGVYSAAFSADGRRLASASGDETVKVWDVVSGQETLTLKGHTATVTGVAFSADGKRLASIPISTQRFHSFLPPPISVD